MRERRLTALELTLLIVVAVVLIASALIGDGGDERSGGGAGASGVTDVKNIKVGPIIRRVETLRGLRFRRPLKITFATPSQAQSLIRSAGKLNYSSRDRLIDEEELKLIGLLEPSVSLQDVLRTIEKEEILGFYDPRSRRLVVIRGKADSRGLQEITLAHELVHALEDQRFGIRRREGFSDDRAAATNALFEGTATALMTDYAERYLDLSDLVGVLNDVAGVDTKLPRFVERQLLFPYEEGERFVTAFRERGNWRAVDQVLRLRHPRSTEQVLHPEKYAIDERPARVRITGVADRLANGWRRLDRIAVGEFELGSLFEQVGEVNEPGAAAGWDGGRFELWRRKAPAGAPCKAPCVASDAGLLRVAWDTARDRAEGEKAFRRAFERGLKGKRLDLGTGLGLWSSRGGAIGMAGRGLETTVVFAPGPSLAVRLMR